MLTNAMRKVGNTRKNGDLQNKLQKLKGIAKEYIKEPSELRNKIAHGEWINAINSKVTSTNENLSHQLSCLDPIKIEKKFKVHGYLGNIVRDLIQSPKSSFHRNYWTHIAGLDEFLRKTRNWDINTRRCELKNKPIPLRIKIDADNLTWLDLHQLNYQKFVNKILREYIENGTS